MLIILLVISSILVYLPESESLIFGNPLQSCPSVLYLWSGQDTSVPNAADFVAVIDFNEASPTYGTILRTVPLVSNSSTGIGQTNNEPHHSSISSNGKYYITGGLLSFLSGQKEIFVWKIPSNPKDGAPTFVCGIDAPGACTDEFQPIGGSKFLVSMMCDETTANSPGDMAVIDAEACTATSLLNDCPDLQDFNPHGYGRLNDGSILVGDFIVPITLAGTDPAQIKFQNTIRWFSPNGNLRHTYDVPFPTAPGSTTGLGTGDGFMEVKTIPNDLFGRGFAGGTNSNQIYLVGPTISTPFSVFDASSVVPGNVKVPSAGIMSIFSDGTRMLMSFQMRYVMLIDITNPTCLTCLDIFDFCSDIPDIPIAIPGTNVNTTFPQFCTANNNIVGSHVVIHPEGENRFVVINYFLKFGLAQFAGTRTVHAFKLNKALTSFTYDEKFNPNFQLSTLQAYPHHAQYLKV